MLIRLTTLALIATFALPTLAHAGGPVVIEDTESAPASVQQKKPCIGCIVIGVIAIGALIALAGSSDVCNGDDPAPTPEPGGC